MKRAGVFGLFLVISAVRVALSADGPATNPAAPAPAPAGAYAPITPIKSTQGRILKIVGWPGYGKLNLDRKLDRAEASVLVMERSSAIFDIWTTWRMLSAPSGIPACTEENQFYCARPPLYEEQFPYRLLGSNRTGVVIFMVGGELAYSYFAPAIPRFIDRRWGERPGKIGKIGRVAARTTRLAGLGFGVYLTEEHVRCGASNIQLTSRYRQGYENYLAGLPPVGQ